MELGDRGSTVDGDEGACRRGDPKVSLQDRTAGGGLDLLEPNVLPATVAKDHLPAGGAHVRHPVRAFSEHRDQEPFASVIHDDERVVEEMSGAPAANLELDEPVTAEAGGSDQGP